jgi:Holliday junction resolvasome RuvABC ATP-dependent DNA helicase subunit
VRNVQEAAIQRQQARIREEAAAADGYLPMTTRTLRELTAEDFQPDTVFRQQKLEAGLRGLWDLVGLTSVKKKVQGIIDRVRQNILNEEDGHPMPKPVLHMLLRGKPGTGKTEVARRQAEILAGLGLLDEGCFIETSGSAILNMTLEELDRLLDSSRGGFLFIDEAYSLADGGPVGNIKLATILKYMEDHRTDIVIALAGYPDDMDRLLEMNPGLHDRIPFFLDFEDYDDKDLAEIIDLQVRHDGFRVDPEVAREVAAVVGQFRDTGDRHFANARTTRKVLAEAALRQASRLAWQQEKTGVPLPIEERLTLLKEDFPLSLQEIAALR